MQPRISTIGATIKMTVYKNACHYGNLTGVKSLENLKAICQWISEQNSVKIMSINIDAMMLSRKGYSNFKPEDIYEVCNKLGAQTMYNPELFPAVYARFDQLPTLVIFRTTSAQALGVKTLSDVLQLKKKFSLILRHLHRSDVIS